MSLALRSLPPRSDVSRETEASLRTLESLVQKWNPHINLVSSVSLPHIWSRHIVDSMQLSALSLSNKEWIDLGSGAGFPGLVIAAIRREESQEIVTLIESDTRKCAFLREAARRMNVTVNIVNERAEDYAGVAGTVSARALAPLDKLLDLALPHLINDGVMLFPKGARWREEVDIARKRWQFTLEAFNSRVNDSSAILRIRNVSHV